jgi:hypothetical protein
MAKRKNKGVRFLETVDFQLSSIKGFANRGRRE